MMHKSGLREVKKEATAHALSEAAFQLAVERGLDGFVVDDVVQKAGYSRRTFANYYSCKEEAVAMAVEPFYGLDEVIELIEHLPDTSTPLDVIYQFAKMQLTEEILRRLSQLMIFSKKHPSFQPYTLSVIHRMQTGAQQLMNQLFQDRYPAGYTHTLAGALFAAILPLVDGSIPVQLPSQSTEQARDAIPLDQYLDMVFGYLRNGF